MRPRAALLGLLLSCGTATEPCRTTTRADGSVRITCPDGSSAEIPAPGVPAGCTTVVEGQDLAAVCADGTRVLLSGRGTCLELDGPGAPACRFDAGTTVDLAGVARVAGAAAHAGTRVTVERSGIAVVTDASGNFTLRAVPAGMRSLRFEHEGLATQRLVNVAVLPGAGLPAVTMRAATLRVPGPAPYSFGVAPGGGHLALPRDDGGADVLELATGFRFRLPSFPTFLGDRWAYGGDFVDLQQRRVILLGNAYRVVGLRFVTWYPQRRLGVLDLLTGEDRLLDVVADSVVLDEPRTQLGYVSRGHLHVLDLVGGEDRDVGRSDDSPVVLGDGVLLHAVDGEARVVRGAGVTILPDLDLSAAAPAAFSGDGRRVLYRRTGGARILLRLGGEEEVVEPAGGGASFVAGGTAVAHWGLDGVLRIYDPASGGDVELGAMNDYLELATGVFLLRYLGDLRVVNARGQELGRMCFRFGLRGSGVVRLSGDRAVLLQDCQDRLHVLDASGVPTLLRRGRVAAVAPGRDAVVLADGFDAYAWEPGRSPVPLGEHTGASFEPWGRWLTDLGFVHDRRTGESHALPPYTTWLLGDRAMQLRDGYGELRSIDLDSSAEAIVERNVRSVVASRDRLFFSTGPPRLPGDPPEGIWSLEAPP